MAFAAEHEEPSAEDKARPWWRYPIVWLVIAGPLAVVIAAVVTAGVAFKHVDPVLDTSANQVSTPAEAPAVKGRNHAASPDGLADQK
jgi:hypothetical protein